MGLGTFQTRMTAFFEDHAANYGDSLRAGLEIVAERQAQELGAMLDSSAVEIAVAVNATAAHREVWTHEMDERRLRRCSHRRGRNAVLVFDRIAP